MKTMILILLLLASSAFAQDFTDSMPVPQEKKTLPLEWRGATMFFDAANKFDAKFSAMNYSFGGSAMIGYRQYGVRAEALAPLSAQGWSYRIKLEYQIF